MKRLMCILLCAGILLSAASCGKRDDDRIYKDSLWYSNVTSDIGDHIRNGDRSISWLNSFFAGYDGERIYYVIFGDYEVPEDADYSKINYEEYYFNYLDVINIDGTLEKSIDLIKDVKLPEEITAGHKPHNLQYLPADKNVINGQIGLHASFDIDYDSKQYFITYDAVNGHIISFEKSSAALDKQGSLNTHLGYGCSFEGYTVREHFTSSLDPTVYLEIKRPDGETLVVNANKSLPEVRDHSITQIIYTGGGKALVEFESFMYGDGEYGLLDLNTGSLSAYAEDTSWFRTYFSSYQPEYVEGSGYIFSFMNSLKLVDFAKKEIRDIFSFDCCNLNNRDLDGLSVLAMTDERIILAGNTLHKAGLNSSLASSTVYVLTKEKHNPNAGKKILTAASTGVFTYAFCEAVRRFNDTDRECFIQLDNRYSYMEKYYNGELSWYDADGMADLQMSMRYEKQLIADVMSGCGPDIIVDPGRSKELYSGDYLLDLSGEIDTSEMFEKAFELSKTDGKLCRIPLTVSVSGIITQRSNAGAGQTGFTFDQYKAFVKGPCNGKDPLGYGRTDVFIDCLGPLYGDHVNGRTVDIDTEDVRALADFVKDNVFEPADGMDKTVFYSMPYDNFTGGMCNRYMTFVNFIDGYKYLDINNFNMMGLPSSDGRGPVLNFSSSVAVSARSEEKEALVRFVRLLLSDEIQILYGEDDMQTPVRISSFESFAEEKIRITNEGIRGQNKRDIAMGIGSEADAYKEIDSSVIENYKNMVESCSVTPSMESAVTIIIYEEMPAYFAGQKTFDDVVKLINNRATTYLNERG
ncbi:MAG: hypothetical protein IKZ42_06745 [Clostridiales bacterium]|nr:hypothetical protein [Clostridiales bacterium]